MTDNPNSEKSGAIFDTAAIINPYKDGRYQYINDGNGNYRFSDNSWLTAPSPDYDFRGITFENIPTETDISGCTPSSTENCKIYKVLRNDTFNNDNNLTEFHVKNPITLSSSNQIDRPKPALGDNGTLNKEGPDGIGRTKYKWSNEPDDAYIYQDIRGRIKQKYRDSLYGIYQNMNTFNNNIKNKLIDKDYITNLAKQDVIDMWNKLDKQSGADKDTALSNIYNGISYFIFFVFAAITVVTSYNLLLKTEHYEYYSSLGFKLTIIYGLYFIFSNFTYFWNKYLFKIYTNFKKTLF